MSEVLKGMLSGTLGIAGDVINAYKGAYDYFMDPALKSVSPELRARIAQERASEGVGGTNWLGRKMGADPESGSFIAGTMVNPGMFKQATTKGSQLIGDVYSLYGKQKANKAINEAKQIRDKITREAKKNKTALTEDQIRAEIWRQTGTKYGVPVVEVQPGEWASEVPDFVNAANLPNDYQKGLLGKIAPNIGSLNTQMSGTTRMLKDLPVQMEPMAMNRYGWAEPGRNAKGHTVPIAAGLNQNITADRLENTLAHETSQHWNSMATRWFRGGNPEQFLGVSAANAAVQKERAEVLHAAVEVKKQAQGLGMTWGEFVAQFPAMVPDALKSYARREGEPLQNLERSIADLSGLGQSSTTAWLFGAKNAEKSYKYQQDLVDRYNKATVAQRLRDAPEGLAYYTYGNLADEGFARATGNRVNKDMQYRIENPFFTNGDMAFKDGNNNVLWNPTLDDLIYEKWRDFDGTP